MEINGQKETETPAYELTPEAATSFAEPAQGFFNRKRVLMTLCIAFAIVVGGGLLLNTGKSKRKSSVDENGANAARAPTEFLRGLRDRSPPSGAEPGETLAASVAEPEPAKQSDTLPSGLPAVTFEGRTETRPYPPPPAASDPGPARSAPSSGGGPAAIPTAYRSSLVPQSIEGSLFGGRAAIRQSAASPNSDSYAEQYPYRTAATMPAAAQISPDATFPRSPATGTQAAYPYTLQNNQQNKQVFYDSGSGGGALNNGRFLGAYSLWIGTLVPGVLETAINTDLPGNALARVTQNIYDSQTGRHLLIPQGTILVAKYNSSVSYAQHRVQIVWDTLIRPDGFQLDLGGMNGVDEQGMSGQRAVYHENWFEYLKAAALITMFSVANARMTEEAAKYASAESASGFAQANAEFVNQMGGNFVSRAMNIQPTLTVENGTLITIMLNKTVYLPPVEDYPVTQKYRLE